MLQSQPAFAEYHDLLEALEERLMSSVDEERKGGGGGGDWNAITKLFGSPQNIGFMEAAILPPESFYGLCMELGE